MNPSRSATDKSTRMEESLRLLEKRALPGDDALPLEYRAYFWCFNRGEYYEAHDALEHLWLRESGETARFFKGLIQFAGAFVHLRKQWLRPGHPKDGRRLAPACRLFKLALANISDPSAVRWRLDPGLPRAIALHCIHQIENSEFTINPWNPENLPRLDLLPRNLLITPA